MRCPGKRARRTLGLVVLLWTILAAGLAMAQEEASPAHDARLAFQARFGDQVRIDWDSTTGTVRHIWGQALDLGVRPRNLEEHEWLAREIFDTYAGLFGADASQLTTVRAGRIRLAAAGVHDKVAVVFHQRLGDLVADGGWASVIFDSEGRIVSIRNSLLPDADRIDPTPSVSESAAFAAASRAFGAPVLEVRQRDFRIVPASGKWGRLPVPAYLFDLRGAPDSDGVPYGRRIAVDAHDGEVLWSRVSVRTIDLIGHTEGWATPGLDPDTGANPEEIFPLGYVRMSSAVGNTDADDAGDWTITYGGSDTQTVTAAFGSASRFVYVVDESGPEISLSLPVPPGVPTTFTLNDARTEYDTAEVNAQRHVVRFREYVVAQDSNDTTMDFRVHANVNQGNSCNAYYDGSSINFFTSGSGCPNTAYSTVITHELGHWANDRYGSGNGYDGFGEGNADNFSMYIFDTPIVGKDFCGTGCNVRDGLNTRQYCGSCGAACYGEVHADGEVLMGAFWKWRRNLNNSLGDAAGDAVADALFMGWMNAYDEYQICHTNEETLLVLDDDDGDIYNGTPHFADIDAGFREQGYPGIDLDFITINHTPVAEQQGEGPIDIVADISSTAGTITSARVYYSVDDGTTYAWVTMNPTGTPDEYLATIPGQPAPEAIDYYIEADDSASNVEVAPDGAPDVDRWTYYVGSLNIIAFFDFEPSDDEGWTHTGSGQDDWQRGAPQGKSTDPTAAYSGTKVWANDLGNSGWDGQYEPNVSNSLTSPTFDLTGKSGTRLKFRRWLAVEKGQYDHARLKVNNTTIWENAYGSDHRDTAWWNVEYDISAIADDNPAVTVSFEMESDGGVEFGGWNLDDLKILTLGEGGGGPPGDCVDPDNYGIPTAGSGNISPTVTWGGGWPAIGNPDWYVQAENTLGGASGAVFIGLSDTYDDSGAFVLLVDLSGPPAAVIWPVTYDGSGPGGGSARIDIPIPMNPYIVGLDVYFQFTVSDPGAAHGIAATDGLHATICDPNG